MAWTELTDSKGWRARYWDANGRRQTAGHANTKAKAQKLGGDQEAKLRGGTWFDPTAGKVTFGHYFEQQWIMNRGGEIATIDHYWSLYRAGLKSEFGGVQLRRRSRLSANA